MEEREMSAELKDILRELLKNPQIHEYYAHNNPQDGKLELNITFNDYIAEEEFKNLGIHTIDSCAIWE